MCHCPVGHIVSDILIRQIVLYLFFRQGKGHGKSAMQEKPLTRRFFLQHGAA